MEPLTIAGLFGIFIAIPLMVVWAIRRDRRRLRIEADHPVYKPSATVSPLATVSPTMGEESNTYWSKEPSAPQHGGSFASKALRILILIILLFILVFINLGKWFPKTIPTTPPQKALEPKIVKGLHPLEVLHTVVGTEHFLIYSNFSEEEVYIYKLFFEGFYDYFKRELFDPKVTKPLKIYLFKDADSFRPFALRRGLLDTNGFYIPKENAAFVNRDLGLGVACHEIVHHFIHKGFKEEPALWIHEGIAMFFERYIAYLDENDELVLSFGYFSSWRYDEIKILIEKSSIDDLILAREHYSHSSSSLMYYLYLNGLFKPFVKQACQTRLDAYGLGTLQAVCGKPLAEIDKEWKAFLHTQLLDDHVSIVSESKLMTQAEYRKWWDANKDRLYWNEEAQVFRLRTKAHPVAVAWKAFIEALQETKKSGDSL